MIVLAWIGQILLFFVAWKLFHWVTGSYGFKSSLSLAMELVVNLVLAIILLIALTNIASAWWLMLIVGAVIGVITGKMGARSSAG